VVSRPQVAHAALLVVGLVLLGAGASLLAQPDYTIALEPVSASSVPSDASPVQFDSLPADDRAILQRALDAPDGTVAVTSERRVDAFRYGDAAGDHYLVRGDAHFRVTTGGGGVLSGADEILAWVLLSVGTLAVLATGRDLYRHRSRGR